MPLAENAVAVRPGDHACCRSAHAEDRERLAAAFVCDGLVRGHKVLYLCDCDDIAAFVDRLSACHEDMAPALASGQLVVRGARETYTPEGTFETEDMVALAREEHTRALAEGYTGLSLTGEMTALCGIPGSEHLTDYERRVADEQDATRVLLCQYDHRRFAAGTLSDVAAVHGVDVPPELAAVGREGVLAAAIVRTSQTMRLAGELDFGCASALADVLHAHFHGPLRFDLADLSYVDVAGMRALRGRKGQPLTIAGASEPVRRLVALLAWDTDPGIEVHAAA